MPEYWSWVEEEDVVYPLVEPGLYALQSRPQLDAEQHVQVGLITFHTEASSINDAFLTAIQGRDFDVTGYDTNFPAFSDGIGNWGYNKEHFCWFYERTYGDDVFVAIADTSQRPLPAYPATLPFTANLTYWPVSAHRLYQPRVLRYAPPNSHEDLRPDARVSFLAELNRSADFNFLGWTEYFLYFLTQPDPSGPIQLSSINRRKLQSYFTTERHVGPDAFHGFDCFDQNIAIRYYSYSPDGRYIVLFTEYLQECIDRASSCPSWFRYSKLMIIERPNLNLVYITEESFGDAPPPDFFLGHSEDCGDLYVPYASPANPDQGYQWGSDADGHFLFYVKAGRLYTRHEKHGWGPTLLSTETGTYNCDGDHPFSWHLARQTLDHKYWINVFNATCGGVFDASYRSFLRFKDKKFFLVADDNVSAFASAQFRGEFTNDSRWYSGGDGNINGSSWVIAGPAPHWDRVFQGSSSTGPFQMRSFQAF